MYRSVQNAREFPPSTAFSLLLLHQSLCFTLPFSFFLLFFQLLTYGTLHCNICLPMVCQFFFFFLKTLMYLSVWPTVWILLNLPCSAPLQFFHSLFSCSVLHLNLFQPTLYCSHAAWYLSWRSFCWLILRKSLFQMFLFSASLFLIFNENTLIYLSGWLKRKYQFYLL